MIVSKRKPYTESTTMSIHINIYLAQIHVRNLELSCSSHTLPPTELPLTC